MKRTWFATALLAAAVAAPAAAQQITSKISVEPYIGYGFFGGLPDTDLDLEGALTYGGRVAYQLRPQWALFGNYQRSTPDVTLSDVTVGEVDVDNWSVGAEFSYVPRGGAEGMLPILLEAGLGQVRYGDGALGEGDSDFAVNLGIGSALRLSRNLSIRYGANDYISNFRDNGVENQFFVRAGAELSF
ncbi:hypothetical protein BH23GEM4_BH23GEM4_05480 [soil metagenome]